MRKITTDDLKADVGKVNHRNETEVKSVKLRQYVYLAMAALFAVLAIMCLVKRTYTEGIFGGFAAALMLFWAYTVKNALKPPKVVVFLNKGESEYYYDPNNIADKSNAVIITEERALKKGYTHCPNCEEDVEEL